MVDVEPPGTPLLTAPQALELICPFFGEEWANTDIGAISVKRLTGGLQNIVYLVRRNGPSSAEPATVLVRHFGFDGDLEEPAGDSATLSAAQQAIVFWELSHRGWGPQLYGLFPGGRVEEYIDSRNLTAAESVKPAIFQDIARSYARFHSLQLPFRKDNFECLVRDLVQGAEEKRREVLEALYSVDDPVASEMAGIWQEIAWAQELDWVSQLFRKYNCKRTLTHGDANYLNILVKKVQSDCQTVLIDYETASYGYRGFDIGGHFIERMYCYNQPDTQLTSFEAPDSREQRSFCAAYLQEMKAIGEQLSGYDTVDHLVLEAKIGTLYQLLFTNLMCTAYDEVETEPLFLSGLVHMMKMYRQLKLEFLEAHLT